MSDTTLQVLPNNAQQDENPNRFYTLKTYQTEQSLGFMAGRCINKIADAINLALKDVGITHQHFGVLHAILRGKAKSPTELAQLRYQDGAAITYVLNVLEKRSLLVRTPSIKDRRIIELQLTQEGENLTRACLPLVIEAQNQALSPLTTEEYATLSALLSKLAGQGSAAPSSNPSSSLPSAKTTITASRRKSL